MKHVRIHQIVESEHRGKRFLSYENQKDWFGDIRLTDYTCVYDGELGTNDLEEIWSCLNEGEKPAAYTGTSLSMSDIVELYDDNGSTFHYVDTWGFVDVTSELNQSQEENSVDKGKEESICLQ